ncbi:glycophorin-A isoform X3 [Antechinus flavipes]|uniref:glycophorin-A isoform X3 n=1 Tax=Antechinus flavipes TaxID=38775 RepID=UPI00223682E0|nr:glycophorin-A isoform X3 [Antechinus flavipes]
MYEEIVLLLLLLGPYLAEQKHGKRNEGMEEDISGIDLLSFKTRENQGYNFTSVIPQKPLRRSRTAEVPVTAYPGDISIEETTTHKTSTSLPVTSQKPTIHQRRKETDTVRTTEGYVSTQDPSDPEEQAATQGPAHTTEHMNIITYHNLRTSSPTEESVKYGPKGRIIHKLSGPVITVIVFAVIAGIIGVILFGSVLVRRLTTRNH